MVNNVYVEKRDLGTLLDNGLSLEENGNVLTIRKDGESKPLVEVIFHEETGDVLISNDKKYEWVDEIALIYYCAFYRTLFVQYEKSTNKGFFEVYVK